MRSVKHRQLTVGGCVFASACLLITAGAARGAALGTAFTFQGRLQEGGTAVNGSRDFTFLLYDADTGGNKLGTTIGPMALSVSEGLFTTPLDFGAAPHNGQALWLEIHIDGQLLTPRQPLTGAPYALQTRGMFVDPNDNVTFDSLSAVQGTVTMTSPGGINLILDADTNDSGEDQNARVVLRQDGGAVAARVGYRDGLNKLEIMQEFNDDLILGSNNQDRVTIEAEGDVGIGTSTPDRQLEVRGPQSLVRLRSTSGGDGSKLELMAPSGLANTIGSIDFLDATAAELASIGFVTSLLGSRLLLTHNGINALAVDQSGNVGIGTSFPSNHLTVSGDADFINRVGIGTASPDADLHLSRAAPNRPAILLSRADTADVQGRGWIEWGDETSGNAKWRMGTFDDSSTYPSGSYQNAFAIRQLRNRFENNGAGFVMLISDSGRVGIGTAIPTSRLHVGGDIRADGSVFASCGTLICSDTRYKTRIRPLNGALEKVAQLRPVSFDWKGKQFPDHRFGEERQIGLIAQEVREVLPEVVREDAEGYLSLDYSKLTPLLIEAIRELQGTVEEKESKLAVLRAENDRRLTEKDRQIVDLTARLERMEAMMAQLTEATSGGAE